MLPGAVTAFLAHVYISLQKCKINALGKVSNTRMF